MNEKTEKERERETIRDEQRTGEINEWTYMNRKNEG